MFPKHIACVPNSRQALAPYNFVELPDQVVPAQPIPDGDRYHPDRYTGKIECILTTESPLYIRCGLTLDEFKQGKEAKDLPDFFYIFDKLKPVIPGSSIRGMLRTLVEISSFSKIDRVADSQLIYRAVGDTTSLGERYREQLLRNLRNNEYTFLTQAGYMIQTPSGGWKIRPARELVQSASFARIEKDEIPKNLRKWRNSENAYRISVSVDPIKTFSHNHDRVKLHYAKAKPREDGEENGVLVKTGSAPRKHMQFVFGLPETDDRSDISIPNELIEEYKNQITDGQKKILGAEGVLLNDQPVFYLLEENQLIFFGHTMMFRLPYRSSITEFMPSQLRSSKKSDNIETTDFADAIFGFVRDEKQDRDSTQAVPGRVFISDAVCQQTNSEDIWLSTSPIVSKILAGPKPTTFQHYLVQTSTDKPNLKHYGSVPVEETVIRGHKLYWHKKKPTITLENPEEVSDTQKTQIKPIKPGVSFQFMIHFENLSKVELGALLWVLDLAQDEQYRLSLGMGKPLGMGAVKIAHQLYFNQRKQRYETLFADEQWFTGYSAAPDSSKPYIEAFDAHIRQAIGAAESSLKDVQRIKMLLAMLSWTEAPSSEQTRYLEIERDASQPHIGTPKKGKVNEYADRPVLPTPLQVIGWKSCGNENDNPNSGNSGKGNSPKPNSPKPGGRGDRSAAKPQKSSSAGTGKTSMAAAFERATQRPKRP